VGIGWWFRTSGDSLPLWRCRQRQGAVGPQRTPNPHRTVAGIDRAAPSNRRARAQRNSSSVLSPLGSAVLDLVLALWPQWRDSLIIVQPETVLRWRREGWSALWRYRSRGRWRGGRPRVSSEVRHLIVRMARENFLWGAPRIHGELTSDARFQRLQATVSRYLPIGSRPPGQSWRTFLCNQAMAFSHHEYAEERSRADARRNVESLRDQLKRPGAVQIAAELIGLRRGLSRQQPTSNVARISLRSAHSDRGVTHRSASVSGGSGTALHKRPEPAFPIRSPPRQEWSCRYRDCGRALRTD